MRPVGLYARRTEKGVVFYFSFFFFFYDNPRIYLRCNQGQRSVNSRREIITHTGRGSFVTKVLFFIRRCRGTERKRRGEESGPNTLIQREPDVTPISLLLLFFPLLFSGGGQRCENRDATNYANARFDAATSISAGRNNIYGWPPRVNFFKAE